MNSHNTREVVNMGLTAPEMTQMMGLMKKINQGQLDLMLDCRRVRLGNEVQK